MSVVRENLRRALEALATEYKGSIDPRGRAYVLIELARLFEVMGLEGEQVAGMKAIVPLKSAPADGHLGIAVNGLEFTDYAQLVSGIAVKARVAELSGLDHTKYKPFPRMTLFVSAG